MTDDETGQFVTAPRYDLSDEENECMEVIIVNAPKICEEQLKSLNDIDGATEQLRPSL